MKDSEVYEEARTRVGKLKDQGARSLAETMLVLMGSRKERKRAAKRKR